MTDAENPEPPDLSRRRLLRGAAWVAGGGAWLAAGLGASLAEAAETKMSQKLANYHNAPHGKLRCDNCVNWQAPSSCKLVQSPISPSGYCQLYASKP
jgi:hypothetical protein